MSLISATAPYRRDEHQGIRIPVVMPVVEVTVNQDGFLTVTLDREPYSAEGALQRRDLRAVVETIAADLGTPVRVDVHEADKSSFTDIVSPHRQGLHTAKLVTKAPPCIGEVAGRGFLPDEEVEIAVVVARQVASNDGTARVRLPPALLEAHPGLVLLVGKESGTVMVGGAA